MACNVVFRQSRLVSRIAISPRCSVPSSRVSVQPPRTWQSQKAFSIAHTFQEKRYTAAHEWIEISADGSEGTIGISTYAAKQLGDVVYVELPVADLEVNAGDAIGAVESVKSASDIYAPIGGTVIEANALLEEKPGAINKGPEGDGWIAKMKLKEGESEKLKDLMSAEEYTKHVEE